MHVDPIEQPAPVLATAVVAKTQADDDKLASALHRLQDEDPALVVDRDEETHQTVLRGTGETHLAITLERLERKFGVNLTTEDVQVRYRETISAAGRRPRAGTRSSRAATASSRWPASRSSRSSAARASSSSTRSSAAPISRGYIPAVAKGVEEAMGRGGVNGYPVVDVRVHARRRQGAHASTAPRWRSGPPGASRSARPWPRPSPVVLEPISRLDVTVPDRPARRRDGRPQLPAGQGAGHRAGRRRRAGDLRPRARERAAPLRHRPALAHRWPRAASPSPTTTTTCCPSHLVDRIRKDVHDAETDAMATRPPADAVVALRSMGRRWRGLFAGLDEDESADALAHRPGADGRSALDHAVHATRTLQLLGRALEQVVVDDDAVLHPAVGTRQRSGRQPTAGVDDAIDELAHEAERLADRSSASRPATGRDAAGRGPGRRGRCARGRVGRRRHGVADLKAAEATLREVDGRP